jgi:hypothetical protein
MIDNGQFIQQIRSRLRFESSRNNNVGKEYCLLFDWKYDKISLKLILHAEYPKLKIQAIVYKRHVHPQKCVEVGHTARTSIQYKV